MALMPVLHDQQKQRTLAGAAGHRDGQVLLAPTQRAVVRHGPVQLGEPQEASNRPGCLPQWQPEQRPSRIRHAWMAASEKMAGRPRRPCGAPSLSISGSNQISSDPRCRRAALQARQLVVRCLEGAGLLIRSH